MFGTLFVDLGTLRMFFVAGRSDVQDVGTVIVFLMSGS